MSVLIVGVDPLIDPSAQAARKRVDEGIDPYGLILADCGSPE